LSAGFLANFSQSLSPTSLDVLGQVLGRMLVVIVEFAAVDGVEPGADVGSESHYAFVPFHKKPESIP
jgi:hypothetical protein